jgi:hypothetical protein
MAVIENVAQVVVHSDNLIELIKKENQKIIVDNFNDPEDLKNRKMVRLRQNFVESIISTCCFV